MKLPLSWLRDFVDVPEDATEVVRRLGACGFEVAGVEGDVIDVEVTTNRPDALSVTGLAREVAAAFDRPLRPPPPDQAPPPGASGPEVPVTLEDPACPRYAVAVLDVTVGPSPDWLAARLHAAGVRPINTVVDASNYVMLEMGHPTHAFDLATLAGPEIRVRRARAGERLRTLDGADRALDPSTLVIADRDRAIAVAGVMGGAATEVSAATRRVALESAWFDPVAVRRAGRRLALKTEAAARFERGADRDAPVRAIAAVAGVLHRIGAGRPAGPVVDVHPAPPPPRALTLRRARLAALLGAAVPDADVVRILGALGFAPEPAGDGWRVTVPAFRVDVAREADLVEEVGRHWGFDRIPATFPALTTAPRPSAPGVSLERQVRRTLGGGGLQEAVTFTFIEREAAAPFAAGAPVALANPLSEKFAVLRPSLVPGLLDSLVHNRHREIADVRLFEVGSVFGADGERRAAGWVLAGARQDHWSGTGGPVDAWDARGVADLLAEAFGLSLEASAADAEPGYLPGRTGALHAASPGGPVRVGTFGQVHPGAVEARGLGRGDAVFAGEVDLAALAGLAAGRAAIAPLPRHPAVVRDLSFFVDERLPAAAVRGTIRAHAPATLVGLREFDRYQGAGVPAGQVGLAIRLTFRDPDRTLTDAEVQQAVDALVDALAAEHGAALRGAPRRE